MIRNFAKFSCRYYLAVLFLLLSTSAFSQSEPTRSHIGIGFHSEMNSSKVKFVPAIRDNDIRYETVNGFSGGFILNLMAEKHAGVQLEVNISNKGWKEIKDSAYTYSRRMRYLEIPVLTHLAFGNKRFRYIFNLGPYIAFHRKSTDSFEPFSNQTIDTAQHLMQSVDNPVDLGFMIDAGFGINTSIGVFQLKARYAHSITNIFNEYPNSSYRYSQNQSVYVGISYYYILVL